MDRRQVAGSSKIADSSRYFFCGHVHWAEVDGLIFVLDELAGQYFGLEAEDGDLWPLVCAPSRVEDGDRLRRLRADVLQRGWVTRDETPAGSAGGRSTRSARRPTPWQAWIALVRACWLLRRGGFTRVYAWAREVSQRAGSGGGYSLDQALKQFVHAEAFVLSRLADRDCLPRSLALFVFLRRAGFAVRHHIGLQAMPFAAHAWVECGTVSLLEGRPLARDFTTLSRLD